MAPLIYLDTHVVAWLYAGRLDLLPIAARRRLEAGDLLISPMVELELEYLFENRRTTKSGREVVESLRQDFGLKICDLPFPQVIEAALEQTWTHDPIDRILVAQAALRQAPLLTKDDLIRKHYARATWDE